MFWEIVDWIEHELVCLQLHCWYLIKSREHNVFHGLIIWSLQKTVVCYSRRLIWIVEPLSAVDPVDSVVWSFWKGTKDACMSMFKWPQRHDRFIERHCVIFCRYFFVLQLVTEETEMQPFSLFNLFFFSFFVISFYVCVSVCLFCLASPAMNNSNPKWHRASWESFNLMKLSLPDITYWCAVLHLWASNCSNLTTQQLIHYDDFQSRMMESHIIGNQSFIDISCIFCINLAMTDIVLGWKLSHVVFRNLS